MKNHTDKFLLGFLGFGIFLYLLSMGYREDPSADLSGNPVRIQIQIPLQILLSSPFGGHNGSITKKNISRKLYAKRSDRDALETSHAS